MNFQMPSNGDDYDKPIVGFSSQILIGFFSLFLNLLPIVGPFIEIMVFIVSLYLFFAKRDYRGFLIGILIALGIIALAIGLCFAFFAPSFH
jgi:hypothetical protein